MKNTYIISKFSLLASAFVGIAAVTGCDTDLADQATLRVIHASPDAPEVNVSLDSTTRITDLDYAASSGFVRVNAGTRDITVEAIIPGGNADVISVPDFPLEKDVRYTIIAVNETATIAAYVDNDPRVPCNPWVVHFIYLAVVDVLERKHYAIS